MKQEIEQKELGMGNFQGYPSLLRQIKHLNWTHNIILLQRVKDLKARYTNLLIPTYIAHKHPKWTIYHVYNEIPCRQGFLPLDGHSWHTYIPIPWLWSKLYNNHPIFDDNSFTLVDFL